MALPDFGLMTKADKLKLDAIDTTTLLTKTEAATTYATKAEMREYIKQVVESDTGFVFINGNDSEVGVIPAFSKPSPELSLSTNSIIFITANLQPETVTASRLGNGAITVITPSGSGITATVDDTSITLTSDGTLGTFEVTVLVAETSEYAAESTTLTATVSSNTVPRD